MAGRRKEDFGWISLLVLVELLIRARRDDSSADHAANIPSYLISPIHDDLPLCSCLQLPNKSSGFSQHKYATCVRDVTCTWRLCSNKSYDWTKLRACMTVFRDWALTPAAGCAKLADLRGAMRFSGGARPRHKVMTRLLVPELFSISKMAKVKRTITQSRSSHHHEPLLSPDSVSCHGLVTI